MDKRPAEADNRKTAGHWKGNQSCNVPLGSRSCCTCHGWTAMESIHQMKNAPALAGYGGDSDERSEDQDQLHRPPDTPFLMAGVGSCGVGVGTAFARDELVCDADVPGVGRRSLLFVPKALRERSWQLLSCRGRMGAEGGDGEAGFVNVVESDHFHLFWYLDALFVQFPQCTDGQFVAEAETVRLGSGRRRGAVGRRGRRRSWYNPGFGCRGRRRRVCPRRAARRGSP